ncbi:MAG TPA: phosphoribosylanthranilate isomerase [Methanocorpusculum sp.]|nr:phosphoribosylanthranilate isomerase [Methanocorpusculum sp.]
MRVKICGTATFADLICAVRARADAIGFLMGITHTTQDAITPEATATMVAKLPSFIEPVAVTHLTKPDQLIQIIETSQCKTLQIQDIVTLEDMAEIRETLPDIRIIKTVHVMDTSAIATVQYFADLVDAILLDTKTEERIGGTGIPHDWDISAKIVEICPKPVILAGGLTPENVKKAIYHVKPYAVDVHTGVKKNGIRNLERTITFVKNAKTSRFELNFN